MLYFLVITVMNMQHCHPTSYWDGGMMIDDLELDTFGETFEHVDDDDGEDEDEHLSPGASPCTTRCH